MGEGVVGLLRASSAAPFSTPGGVEARGELAVGVAHQAHADLPGVLGRRGLELVDVAGGEAQLELDVLDRRTGTHPELAVAGVGEELVAVAVAERAEVEHGLVAAARLVTRDRLQHQHGIRLAVGAQAGEPGEGGVRSEDVVGVVAPHLQAAGGDDEALPGVCRAEHRTPRRSRAGCRGGPVTPVAVGPTPPGRRHGTRRSWPGRGCLPAVLALLAHPPMLPRGSSGPPVKDCPDGSAQRSPTPRTRRGPRCGSGRRLRRACLGGRRGPPQPPLPAPERHLQAARGCLDALHHRSHAEPHHHHPGRQRGPGTVLRRP